MRGLNHTSILRNDPYANKNAQPFQFSATPPGLAAELTHELLLPEPFGNDLLLKQINLTIPNIDQLDLSLREFFPNKRFCFFDNL